MKPWWEKYPERLEFELQELKNAGILCEQDQTALAEGVVVLHLVVDAVGHPGLKLKVIYPEFYPEFPFEIEAHELSLPHHQNPFEKNLCFLDNPGQNWDGKNDTVARFIQDRLSKVLAAGYSNQKNDLESPRSEPFSNFIRFSSDSMILVNSAWTIAPEVSSGKLVVGLSLQTNKEVFRGAILGIQNKNNVVLATSDEEITNSYGKRITGRWIRFGHPPSSNDIKSIFEEAVSKDNRLKNPLNNQLGQLNVDVIGILFPEETKWRENGDGWIFIVRIFEKNKVHPLLVRGGRAGKSDLQGRNPSLRGIENKKIAVFGLGCIGASSAVEFARSGVGELRLLDDDHVEPGTTVRWPFGLQTAAGRNKSSLLASIIAADHPFTRVGHSICRLGRARQVPSTGHVVTEQEVCNKMLDGVDLLYDATAELAVNRLLSRLASERGIPYLLVAGTPGMWGGRVIRILPGGDRGCWACYRHATSDKSIPTPIYDQENGMVAPEGCRAPTFTGTNFDASEISMAGVRMAISTLMMGIEGGYPPVDWDVSIINLRDNNGAVIPPQWSIHKLAKHPKCHCRRQ
jgi:molybdopterin/thiamine biosynthesis adenylyltransferase